MIPLLNVYKRAIITKPIITQSVVTGMSLSHPYFCEFIDHHLSRSSTAVCIGRHDRTNGGRKEVMGWI